MAAGLVVVLLIAAAPARGQLCVGDCNGDGEVRVDELLRGVNIALGLQPVSNCLPSDPDQNGTVTVAELITAVNNALRGCPRTATPSPTHTGVLVPSPTPTPPATPTTVVVTPTATNPSPTHTALPQPPVLQPIADQQIFADHLLSVRAEASDANAGDTLAFSLAAAPIGMAVDAATGAIQWTPRRDQLGAADVTVRVQDGTGLFDTTSFRVTVRALGSPPQLQPIAPQRAVVASAFAVQAAATDPDPGDVLIYSLLLAPPGMSIVAQTGAIAWTPGAADLGEHDVTVQVADATGLTDVTAFAVTVAGINTAPVAADDSYVTRIGETLAVAAPGVIGNDRDADGDPLAASVIQPPANGTLILSPDGSFSYTPDVPPPVPGGLNPVFEWTWTAPAVEPEHVKVMVSPAVADLDQDGTPEVIFVSHLAQNDGILRAVNGEDGSDVFSAADPALRLYGISSMPAVGNLDGDRELEIVGTASDNEGLIAFEHDGSLKWRSRDHPNAASCDGTRPFQEASPQLADLDGDGTPEIVIGASARIYVFDADGQCRFRTTNAGAANNNYRTNSIPIVADLDLDGLPEIVAGRTVYPGQAASGSVNVLPKWQAAIGDDGWNATGNFDDDPFPEIVLVSAGNVYLFEHTGALKWGPIEIPHPGTSAAPNGGAPTVADFDGDGEPEIGIAGNTRYVVLETDGSIKWTAPIDDSSSHSTGSTVFDFENDGAAEVVYCDEHALFIYRGSDGEVLYQTAIGSATTVEYPVVVDIDGDGHAEIVVPSERREEIPDTNPVAYRKPGLYALGGADHNWVRARAIWNQLTYHVTNVLSDGTIPAREQANWLTPGLNDYRHNAFLPDEPERADRFTYRVDDGALASNAATVFLDVLPPDNAPAIVSSPVTKATAGFGYLYGVRAVDPDPGDTLTFSLTLAPAGMTIDPPTGLIRWTPGADQIAEHTVAVKVEDVQHLAAFQTFAITVSAPVDVPDVVGLPRETAGSTLVAAGLETGAVSEENHRTAPAGTVIAQDPPAGAVAEFGTPVALRVSLGPAPLDVDDDGDLLSENEGDCNDANAAIHPGAADPDGDGVDQNCDGEDGVLALAQVTVEPAARQLVAGEQIQLTARAVYTNGTSRDVTAQATWASTASGVVAVDAAGLATAAAPGSASVRATVTGVTGQADLTVLAAEVGDAAPPVALITAPAANDTVTAPVQVLGTADDPNFLRYELAIAPAGAAAFRSIGGGTAPVAGGVLGTLDPTLLLNDQYMLRLTVADTGGNVATFSVVVQIDGNQKIGAFTLAFTDLTIPLSGIPIQVVRVYDSRDKQRGDFGVGWRLGVQTLRLSTNRVPGTGWIVRRSHLTYGLIPTDAHKVSVRLPNGRIEEFDFVATPAASPIIPFGSLQASLVARPGTLGKLEVVGNSDLVILDPQPGPVELLDDATFAPFDPQRFRYTAEDGTATVLTRQGVESIEDPNGNTLTFGPNGIVHSSGRSVTMTRDTFGRITEITDLAGSRQRYSYDANGDLERHADATGNVTRFLYDAAHGLLRIIDPLGRPGIRNEFDDTGRLIATTDARGNRYTFSHDLDGRESTETDPTGGVQRLKWDGRGNVTQRERTVTIDGVPTLVREQWEYDANDQETVHVDGDGRRTEMAYDDGQRLTQIALDPQGLNLMTRFTYDATGNLLSETDPEGHTRTFAYDSRRNPIRVTDASGQSAQFVYGARGRLTRTVDLLGNTVGLEFDADGNITRQVVREGGGPVSSETRYTYDANGRMLTETIFPLIGASPAPASTQYTYDAKGRPLSIVDPLGGVTRAEYDAAGALASVTDALNHATRHTYDAAGNRIRTDFADGTFETATYNGLNQLTEATDRAGRTTSFDYDEAGRRVRTRRPDGTETGQIWSAGGLLLAEIDGNGHRTDYEYDTAGRRVRRIQPQVIDAATGLPARPETRFEHDGTGALSAVISPTGRRVDYQRDSLTRLVRTRFADGTEQLRSYDAAGRIASLTDEEGRSTEYRYDPRGLLIEASLPRPRDAAPRPVTSYGYDQAGLLQTRTDALGRTTTFQYDAAGRLFRHTLPGGEAETFDYDAAGNVRAHTDFAGRTTTFTYDAFGRPVSRQLPGAAAETIAYTPTGRRQTVIDANGTWTYGYDALDRLVSLSRPDNVTLSYSYDGVGHPTVLSTGATTVTRAWDALGRQISVTSTQGTTAYAYDLAGNLVRTSAPNGVQTERAYDGRNRLVEITHRAASGLLLASYAYTLSPSGRRTHVAELSGAEETYTHDGLDRLIAETRAGSSPRSVTYEYDAAGNRTRRVAGGVETLYRYDSNDRLLAAGSSSLAYDANGNLAAAQDGEAVATYEWDALNRLVRAQSPAGTAIYTYDFDGRRIAESDPAGTRQLVVDIASPSGVDDVVEERDGVGLRAAYTHGQGLASASVGGQSFVHLADALGSIRMVTDAGGAVAAAYDYDGYGALQASSGAVANPYLFAGERFDDVPASYYLRARSYDPGLGRFLSRDPFPGLATDPVTFQPYLYARANPVDFTDPTGQWSLAELSIVQEIRSLVEDLEYVEETQAACRVQGALAGINTVLVLTQVAANLLVDEEGERVSDNQVVLLHLGGDEPGAASQRAFLGEDIKEVLVAYDSYANALKIAVETTSGPGIEFTIPGSGAEVNLGKEIELWKLQACGVSFGKVSMVLEGKFNSSSSSPPTLTPFAMSAEVEVLGRFKTKIPILVLQWDPKNGFRGNPFHYALPPA